MRALRFYGNKDLRVEDIADPKICGPRQVIVKVAWCGICGTDLHEYTTGPIFMPRQQILGHEFSGTVVEVGSELKDYRQGDRVAVQPLLTPGDDYYSVRGLAHLSEQSGFVGIRNWAWGGMGEYAVLNDYNVFKLPDSVSDEQGALVEPAAVTLYAVDNSGLQAGNTVLISGAGTIGALTVLSVNAAGASQIFVAEPNPARRKFIESWGLCTGVFDPRTEDVPARIRERTTVGVDAAFECAGTENSLAACLRSVRRQGTVVQVGLATATCTVDLQLLVLKDVTLRGSFCYPIYSWPRVIDLIAARKLPVEKTVSSCISLDAAVPDGFEVLTAPGTDRLKILIRPAD
jgi:(R,R)-butanediol dehydrogenase / meso-butanediol dehydrogenase / diacetyl reductase